MIANFHLKPFHCRFLVTAVAFSIGLFFTGPLRGEDFFEKKEQVIENSLLKLSIFYVRPLLSIDDMGYSTNIYYFDEIETPDFTADVGLDLTLSTIVGNRFIFQVNEHPYYTFYAENKDEESWNNEFTVSAFTYLGSFNLTYSWRWDDVKRRPNSEFGTRVKYLTRSHLASLDIGRHNRFYFTLYGEWRELEYRDESYLGEYPLSSQNHRRFSTGIRLTKTIFTRTRIYLRAEYFQFRFRIEPERDSDGESLSMGFIFPQDASVTGEFELGYKRSRPLSPLYTDFSTPFGRGEVALLLARRFRIKLNYLWDNAYSVYQTDLYFNNQSITGGIEYYFTRGLKIGLSHQIATLVYRTLVDDSETRRDTINRSGIALTFRVFRNMGVGIEYVYYTADSSDFNYRRSYQFIGGHVTYDF